jgi:UDP-N-acetylglucosamine transferase subunit ALG13
VSTTLAQPLLLVTVGTDHHPFDRLVRWVEAWLDRSPERELRCLLQTGTSSPPARTPTWQAYLEHSVLEAAMTQAAAVVCHGGPGTILGARQAGAVPIVVPRQQRLGEHVDDHQVRFSRRLAAEGGVFLAESEGGLHELLDRVVSEPGAFRAPASERGTAAAVQAFERLVDDLVAGRPHPQGALR